MFDFFSSIGSALMTLLYYPVSAVLKGWHWVFDTIPFLGDGWVWALSIVGLTVTIRALLIPLFVKQINSSRNMQLLQPKIKELQKKYGHDRERLAQEQMKLWKDTGTNPFASCLPMIVQMPIFFALFRVLDGAAKGHARGLLTAVDADSLSSATIFGAEIAATFVSGGAWEVRVLTMTLVVTMCATTFLTQRQLMTQNMPAEAMTGPYAQQQKMLLYVLPFAFAFGGFFFPLGVLIYWTTTNLWTMGQQFYVIRRNPAPGTPAFAAKQERDRAAGKLASNDPKVIEAAEVIDPPKPRQQPKKQPRSQRSRSASASAGRSKDGPVTKGPDRGDRPSKKVGQEGKAPNQSTPGGAAKQGAKAKKGQKPPKGGSKNKKQ